MNRPSFLRLRASALLLALLPSSLFAVEPVRVVATGGRIGNTFYAPAAANTAFRQRTPHKLGGPVAEMRIGFMDWMYTDKTETANATNDVTLDHVWLERASTGQIVPVTFGGSRQLVLPMNSTTSHWLSDVVPSSVWTGVAPARDEVFWLHVKGSIPSGGKLPVGTPASYAGAKAVVYPPANDPGTHDVAGPVPTIAGSTARIAGLPLVFLGRFTGPGHLSVIGIGDSIMDGSGDAANPVPAVSGFGFFNRAAVDSAGQNAIAMFNLTRHGQTAAAWVNPSKQSRQAAFLAYANVVAEEYGTNDLGSAGGGNVATILANTETIWNTARAAGVQKIVRTKLMPRTASTDSWTTLLSQTPNTGWGPDEKRDQINAGFEAALAAGKIDVLVDTLGTVADPSDTSRWLTNGVAKYATTDGTHVSPAGNALLASPLRAALLSLEVDAPAPVAAEVVIDNTDGAPAFVASSGWVTSTGASGYLGVNYLHDNNTGKGSKNALYTPALSAPGDYEVFVRWISHANRATNVPVEVVHAGGSASHIVNQTTGGGVWYSLGTYTFAADGAEGVFIENTGTTGYVTIDAVRFAPAP